MMAIARRAAVVGCMFMLALSIASAQEAGKKNQKKAKAKQAAEEPAASAVMTYKKVGDTELKMYIFNPADQAAGMKRPAIVFFFGGGWTGGAPRQFEEHCRYLASRGVVAMTADYRVFSRQKATVAECVSDAKSAIRWAREHAAQLGIDPERIVAGGGSAGGHLAAATATLEGFDDANEDSSISSKPNALVLFNPALDLRPEAFNRTPEEAASSDLASRLGASVEDLTPSMHISRDLPPTIIFHGKADSTVPFAQVEAFSQGMRASGVLCEVRGYDGQQHGFFNFGRGDNSNFLDTLKKTDAFLASLGYTTGEPTVDVFFTGK